MGLLRGRFGAFRGTPIALPYMGRSGVGGLRKHKRSGKPFGDVRPTASAFRLNSDGFKNAQAHLGGPGVKHCRLDINGVIDPESMPLPLIPGNPLIKVHELLVAGVGHVSLGR